MSTPATAEWHITQNQTGECSVVTAEELAQLNESEKQETWGPYASENDAIAKRVGLIRAGKCKPA